MPSGVSLKKFAPISSKFTPARLRVPPLTRKELAEKFNLEKSNQFIAIVTAPAGYGKSTFLSQWYECYKNLGYAVAWLNLERSDNDPGQFLQYLIGAFQQVNSSLGERSKGMLLQTELAPYQLILESLLDDIRDFNEKIFLFIDDLHFINEKAVLEMIDRMMQFLPNHLYLVLACRYRPKLSFAGMKAEGKLVEFNQSDLGFSLLETQQFLTQLKKIHLKPEECKQLFHKTEGWPAGLQLVSIALEESENKHLFVQDFSGNDRDITDFLGETVLSSIGSELKKFIFQISILDRISLDLAFKVTANLNAKNLIQLIEKKELFYIPLDRQRKWFRFHHLFKDFLCQRFEQDSPEDFYEAHEKASQWFEEQGFMDEAIEFSLKVKNFSRAALLMSHYAIEAVSTLGKHLTWLRWSSQLPSSYMDQYPLIRIFYSQSLQMDHQYLKCQEEYNKVGEYIQKHLDPKSHGPSFNVKEFDLLRSIYEAMLAYRLFAFDQIELSRQKAEAWLNEWPKVKTAYSGGMQCILAIAYCMYGDFDKARYYGMISLKTAEDTKSYYGVIWTRVILGLTYLSEGNLAGAQKEYEICLNHLQKDAFYPTYCLPLVKMHLAEIYYERGEIDQAKNLTPKNFDSLSHLPYLQVILHYWEVYSRLLKKERKFSGLEKKLKELEVIGEEKIWLRLKYWAQAERIFLYLEQGKNKLALSLAKEAQFFSEDFSFLPLGSKEIVEDFTKVVRIKLMLVQGKHNESLKIIAERLQKLSNKKNFKNYLQTLLFKVQALFQLNRENEALRVLKQTLSLAVSRGFVQIFIEEGKNIQPLFKKLIPLREQIPEIFENGFFEKILQGLKIFEENQSETQEQHEDVIKLEAMEPLTKREKEILHSLDSDDSIKEISQKLFVSQNTLKTHLRNLYTKMSVKNRSGLLEKARRVGFLS